MGCEVYANDNEIACKAGDGKVIAAFPDVCLSPPSPPAGPIPLPYPDTSFSKDMQSGSKTVMIKGKEVMLKDQSFYNTSPLGDEAATKGLGAGVVTHVITGKTYFTAWSMDVKFEGENVDRNTDLTTSNHASMIGNAMAPMINLAIRALAWIREKRGKCTCCGKDPHSTQRQVTMEEFYTQSKTGTPVPKQRNGDRDSSGALRLKANGSPKLMGYDEIMNRVENRKTATPPPPGAPCTCNKSVLPSPPCDKFYQGTTGSASAGTGERGAIASAWKNHSAKYRKRMKMAPSTKVNHKTPKSAGGCPTGRGNLQPHDSGPNALCQYCQWLDDRFGDLQNAIG